MTKGVSQYIHRIRRTASVIRISSPFSGILLSLLILLTVLFNTAGLVAAEPLTLTDIEPPPAIVGYSYEWLIPVQGGVQPYRFSATGDLPLGLSLDAEGGIIYGTPQQCINKASYLVTIRVEDRWDAWAWRIYTFKVKYESNIKAGGTQFAGETNLYIDGNAAGKLKSGQNIPHYFFAAILIVYLLIMK